MFGNERIGLENEEIKHCHAAVLIPSDPDDFASLNLAQAVQVLAYEVRMADARRRDAAAGAEGTIEPAASAAAGAFFEHLARTLDAIDFHKGRSPRTVMLRLRRLFLRAQPDDARAARAARHPRRCAADGRIGERQIAFCDARLLLVVRQLHRWRRAVTSSLSMRGPSRSTTSKRQPSQSKCSPACGMRPKCAITMPAAVW